MDDDGAPAGLAGEDLEGALEDTPNEHRLVEVRYYFDKNTLVADFEKATGIKVNLTTSGLVGFQRAAEVDREEKGLCHQLSIQRNDLSQAQLVLISPARLPQA